MTACSKNSSPVNLPQVAPTGDLPDIPDFLRRNPDNSLMFPGEAKPSASTLADLAARIKAEQDLFISAARTSAEHAMRVGDLLIEAKKLVKHGEWLPWLAQHCDMSESLAQRYMRLARARTEIEAKTDNCTDLSILSAMKLLAAPLDEEESEEDSESDKAGSAASGRTAKNHTGSRGRRRTKGPIKAEPAQTSSQELAEEEAAEERAIEILVEHLDREVLEELIICLRQCSLCVDKLERAANPPPRKGKKSKVEETELARAVNDAFAKLTELAEECREVVDNAPDGLSQTQRIQTLDETANALENLEEPSVADELAGIKVSFPTYKTRSRADRRDASVGIIEACVNALALDESDPRFQAASDLRNELENAVSEAECCEFPGMFQ
jgi:hypothetical protein